MVKAPQALSRGSLSHHVEAEPQRRCFVSLREGST
uniref:Uncharacterized protein n=1 Tax=Rhizophora mucronata TaxID=61149 RepID=A0A2P2R2S1_RHIMU